jgi:hypothetical protein
MKRPENFAEYSYFRRHTGLSPVQCLALVRAEKFARETNLMLTHELGVSHLCERRLREVPLQEGPWEDRTWEFSEELVCLPRPKGVNDRVTAAILALRLWQPV